MTDLSTLLGDYLFGTQPAPFPDTLWFPLLAFAVMLLCVFAPLAVWVVSGRTRHLILAFLASIVGVTTGLWVLRLPEAHDARFLDCRAEPAVYRGLSITVTECRHRDDLRGPWSDWSPASVISE